MKPLPLSKAADEFIRLLRKIVAEGGDGNFLVVSIGDVYVQFAAERGNPTVQCEAVCNACLPAKRQLGKGKLEKLHRIGFEITDDGSNYSLAVVIDEEAALADLAHQSVQVLTGIYGCSPREQVRFDCELGNVQHVANPALNHALEQAEKTSTQDNWDRLFAALLNAALLVPVGAAQGEGANSVVMLKSPDGETALPVFSDYEALTALHADGHSYMLMPGAALFPWAVENELWPIVVNPAGPVVIELSQKQVVTLAVSTRETPAS